MKRLLCLALVLALLPCAAALADLEDWDTYYSLGFTIRYPDYMETEERWEDPRWRMDIFMEPDETGDDGKPLSLLYVLRADEAVWGSWKKDSAFPDLYGQLEPLERLQVDEPPVLDEPEELEMDLTMDMSYALYRSLDGEWHQEVFVFDHPEEEDYVVICRFPADDDMGWSSNVLHWMIATMQFEDYDEDAYGEIPDGLSCPFSLLTDNRDGKPSAEVTVVGSSPAIWLYTDSAITDFRLEQIGWDDDYWEVADAVTLYSDDVFTPEEALAIHTLRPDPAPDLRIRGVNAEGEEEIWYLADREWSGPLVLEPEEDTDY